MPIVAGNVKDLSQNSKSFNCIFSLYLDKYIVIYSTINHSLTQVHAHAGVDLIKHVPKCMHSTGFLRLGKLA